MLTDLEPIQFNFASKWLSEIKKIEDRPSIQLEFSNIKVNYQQIAEFKYEEACEWNKERARAEYELDLHIARVRCGELYWLRTTFEGIDLVDLSLAIAQELYPERKWEILENDEDAIVTDRKRQIVFDIKNFDKLSARGSLFYLGDRYLPLTEAVVHEVEEFRKERIRFFENTLNIIKNCLANSGEIDPGQSH